MSKDYKQAFAEIEEEYRTKKESRSRTRKISLNELAERLQLIMNSFGVSTDDILSNLYGDDNE